MNSIIDFVRRLFGKDTSIDRIVSPMGKIVRDLEAYAERQASKVSKHQEKAELAASKAKAASKENAAAIALAGNYKSLIGAE